MKDTNDLLQKVRSSHEHLYFWNKSFKSDVPKYVYIMIGLDELKGGASHKWNKQHLEALILELSVYDFETIKKSIQILNKKKINIKLFIAGRGGSENYIKDIFNHIENVYFLGWINRKEAIDISLNCHLALAPYKNIKNYELNLVNKLTEKYIYLYISLYLRSPGCLLTVIIGSLSLKNLNF